MSDGGSLSRLITSENLAAKARYTYIYCLYINTPIYTGRAGLLLASNNAVKKLLCLVLVWYLNIPSAFRTS